MRQLKIKKGNRRPWFDEFLPVFFLKNREYKREFIIKFDKSAIYSFNDEDQFDINKLFGFSMGHHHQTSFRFGWRPTQDLRRIEILSYEYQNGSRVSIPIVEVELDKWYRYKVELRPKQRVVKYIVIGMVNNKYDIHQHTSYIKKIPRVGVGYTLGLYFGGTKLAPHDIIIKKISCRLAKNKL
jgi:hypothetical protein